MHNLIPALELISRKLKENSIRYSIIGSTALFLQGIELQPNDIDMVIENREAARVNELLKEYLVKQIPTGKVTRVWGDQNIGLFEISGVKVEIGYSLDKDESGIFMPDTTTAKEVIIGDLSISVSPLPEQLRMYKNWREIGHRKKDARKVELIETFLRKST